MIYTFIPYAPKDHPKCLGWAYNRFMELLPHNEDWAVLMDHDAMFTTSTWYSQIEDIIEKNIQYSCFVPKCNRVGCYLQRLGNRHNHDMVYHREIGKKTQEEKYSIVTDLTETPHLFTGVCMILKKSAWEDIKFKESGFLGVDTRMCGLLKQKKYKIGVLEGVYVYHWYRFK